MSALNMSKADEKNAKLKLSLKAKSGYSATAEYQVSANQWSDIIAICEGTSTPRVHSAENGQ